LYRDFEFASLIIYEQTHATLFVKGQTQFSKELASFVGEQGALAWRAEMRGVASPEDLEALDQITDLGAFLSLLLELKGTLDRVHRTPRVNNAYLSLNSLYSDDVPLIRSYYEKLCGGDLRRLLEDAGLFARRGDAKAQMSHA
jgi:predicted aminopeptidase